MAKIQPDSPQPEKRNGISTTAAPEGEIRGHGSMLRVLIPSLVLAFVAIASLRTYFYNRDSQP